MLIATVVGITVIIVTVVIAVVCVIKTKNRQFENAVFFPSNTTIASATTAHTESSGGLSGFSSCTEFTNNTYEDIYEDLDNIRPPSPGPDEHDLGAGAVDYENNEAEHDLGDGGGDYGNNEAVCDIEVYAYGRPEQQSHNEYAEDIEMADMSAQHGNYSSTEV